jgi:hypothetical protein
MSERQPKWYDTNPVMEWLRGQELTIKQLSLLADTGYVDAYNVLTGYYRTLPPKYRNAIDKRSGDGTGNLVAAKFLVWRQALAGNIGKARA